MHKQTLQEAWDASTHVLADSLLVKDWPKDLPWHAVTQQQLKNETHLLPVVLQLDELDGEQRKQMQTLLVMKNQEAVAPAMLLSSDYGADALARQLAPHVMAMLPDESRVLLRFADPQVFMHLLWILPLEELASICEATGQWSVPFMGEWHEMQFNRRPEASWTALDEQRSVALFNAPLINRILAARSHDGPDAYWRDAKDANEWLRVAQSRFELVNADDCVAFAQHALRFGGKFAAHQTIASYLTEARSQPGAYASRTGVMSTRDWNSVVAIS
ncbi:DUF4123 domain-containing protein [Caballeronia grimmiae]|uniref:DUF4123 domain-containing protein n=1 Tax=Caballeronia grimmiae TaxID=1071679 RepID=UPI0038BB5763